MKENDNFILDASFEFAKNIVDYCEILEKNKKFVIATQLFKSGTSIGANISEAQYPESKADFLHKIRIALKEASETRYWLRICNSKESYPDSSKLLEELKPIIKVLISIIISSKRKK